MKILSLSTATNNLSVAINEDTKNLVELNQLDQRNHSVNIMPTIQEALTTAQLKITDIDEFAVAIGPGSYTGIRIGVTTVKVLADQLHKMTAGISTLQALALNCQQPAQLIVSLLDARNDNFFAGAYTKATDGPLKNVLKDQHLSLDKLIELLKLKLGDDNYQGVYLVGDYTVAHKQKIAANLPLLTVSDNEADNLVHAKNIATLALGAKLTDPNALLPTYLRKTQAEVEWEQKTGESSKDISYVEEV